MPLSLNSRTPFGCRFLVGGHRFVPEHEVVGGHRLAVAPAHSLAQVPDELVAVACQLALLQDVRAEPVIVGIERVGHLFQELVDGLNHRGRSPIVGGSQGAAVRADRIADDHQGLHGKPLLYRGQFTARHHLGQHGCLAEPGDADAGCLLELGEGGELEVLGVQAQRLALRRGGVGIGRLTGAFAAPARKGHRDAGQQRRHHVTVVFMVPPVARRRPTIVFPSTRHAANKSLYCESRDDSNFE